MFSVIIQVSCLFSFLLFILKQGVSLNIISYFFTASSSLVYFQSFLEKCKHLLEISIVIKCIRHDAEGRPILLGLDEIVAAFGKQNVDGNRISKIISEVGKALNIFAWDEFNMVVTTLDTFVVNVEKIQSGRPIEWVILPCLTTGKLSVLFTDTSPVYRASSEAIPYNTTE